MTDPDEGQAAATAPEPGVIEGPGRYKVYETPDGGWTIARAIGICRNCQSCGCGEQAEPVQIPAMVVQLAKRQGGKSVLGMLRGAGRAVR